MGKLGRNFNLIVESRTAKNGLIDQLEINYPLTVEFDITRDLYNFECKARFKIYNLNASTQSFLNHDKFNYANAKILTFNAGYENSLACIFKGNVWEGVSARNGVNFITELDCSSGMFDMRNAMTSKTIKGEVMANDIAERFVKDDCTFLTMGYKSSKSKVYKRGYVYQGSTLEGVAEVTEGRAYIDNDVVIILDDSEALNGEIYIVDAETGLLDTPKRREQYLDIQMIFEPRIRTGQFVDLRTSSGKFSGQYKVCSVKHQGTISGATSGTCITTLSLEFGHSLLTLVG